MRPTLVVFVKQPVAGRVKSRLGREIGMTAAAWWYRHQTGHLLRTVGSDPRWRTVLAVTPDHSILNTSIWPRLLTRWPQGRGDLGNRMAHAFRSMPPGPVIIIGSDIPGIGPATIAGALRALGSCDGVVGPAEDGGYWLIGLRRGGRPLPRGLFRDVRWSSQYALRDTLAGLKGLSIRQIEMLKDVDTAEDLRPSAIRARVFSSRQERASQAEREVV